MGPCTANALLIPGIVRGESSSRRSWVEGPKVGGDVGSGVWEDVGVVFVRGFGSCGQRVGISVGSMGWSAEA